MYLLHCKKCHHEWESTEKEGTCAWCGAGSYFLAEHYFNIYEVLENLAKIIKIHHQKEKK